MTDPAGIGVQPDLTLRSAFCVCNRELLLVQGVAQARHSQVAAVRRPRYCCERPLISFRDDLDCGSALDASDHDLDPSQHPGQKR